MRTALLAAMIVAVAMPGTAAPVAAAVKKRAPVARKPGTPKRTPTETLITALWLNSQRPGESIASVCAHTYFKSLAWGFEGVKDRIVPVKDEFETTADFNARRDRLLGALNDKPIVICMPFDDYDMIATYDADNAKFTVTFKDELRVDLDYKKTGRYVSRTRMGVRATVTQYIDVSYVADMSGNIDTLARACFDKTGYSFERQFSFAADRARAPDIKLAGRVALIGRIVSPIYSSDQSSGSPTLDDPTDTFSATLSVKFAPETLVVLDDGGREIRRCSIN